MSHYSMSGFYKGSKPKYHLLFVLIFALFIMVPKAVPAADDYESISTGITVDEAVKILGKPADFEKDLTKEQLDYVAFLIKDLDNKDSEMFLIWEKENHFMYVLGINKDNKVAVKHRILFLTEKP